MSGQPTIVDKIVARISADNNVTNILVGGVWKRPLKREGPGATPAAFFATPPYQPRPSVVVMDGGDTPDLQGLRAAFKAYPTLYFYAPATNNGWTDITNAYDAVRTSLIGWSFAMPNGTGAHVDAVAGHVGARDAPDVEGALIDSMRLQVSGIWILSDV